MSYKQGKYRARLAKHDLTKNNKDNPQVVLVCDLVGFYDENGEMEACDPGPRTIWRVLTENTIERVSQEMRALGFNSNSWADLSETQGGETFQDLAGVEFDVSMKLETYEGKDKERWELSMFGGVAMGKDLERKSVREIDAKFAKFLKALKPKGLGTAPAGKPSAEPVGAGVNGEAADDGTIPF